MTVCTKHEYAGPHACPYCERDAAQAEIAELTAITQNQLRKLAEQHDEIAELRRELEGAKRDRENALRQCHNMAERAAHEPACTPAERAVLDAWEALSVGDLEDMRLHESRAVVDICDTEFARRARREQPAVTPEQIREAIQKGVRDARIVAGDPVMPEPRDQPAPAPVSGAKEDDE